MKFSPQELIKLGVPQKKIPFFMNREFLSEQSLIDEFEEEKINGAEKPFVGVTAFALLDNLRGCSGFYLPCSIEGREINPSNSEIRRWLNTGSVIINGIKPKWDEVIFPSWDDFLLFQLEFFPNGNKVTII